MASRNILFANIVVLAIVACHSQADLINNVCSKARNAAICNEALRSDPRSKGADLKGLGEIIIEKSIAAVEVATKVSKSVKTPKIEGTIAVCIETQGNAIDDLITSKDALRQGDRGTLSANASGASTDIQTCYDTFEEEGVPQPPQLQQANQNALDLISVIELISTLL